MTGNENQHETRSWRDAGDNKSQDPERRQKKRLFFPVFHTLTLQMERKRDIIQSPKGTEQRTNKTMSNQLKSTYSQKRENILNLLSEIKSLTERETPEEPTQDIDWGTVGSMGHIEELLEQTRNFITGEED